tara:strand:+ start:758 stop:940 length:183 start_codon:yes stop_codon:yes gene_type:complete
MESIEENKENNENKDTMVFSESLKQFVDIIVNPEITTTERMLFIIDGKKFDVPISMVRFN